MEDKLYNKHRVFGTNTSKREAGVRHTDSPLRISGSELPYLDMHKLGRIKCEAHGLPERTYRVRLPYLDMHELRRKKITPPSSPGVGTARHDRLPG